MAKYKENIVIIGAGAQAKYIIDTASYYNNIDIKAIVLSGKIPNKVFKKDLKKIEIIENLESIKKFSVKDSIKAIVAESDNRQKKFLIKKLEKLNIELTNIIHPTAVIAKTAMLDKNILINAGVVIQPYACIGKGVMVHANVVIEHDCKIGDYVNLGPGVKLAGWVTIKNDTYVYTGASVIPRITIGTHSIVGAAAAVIKDVPDNVTVAGNPADIIKNGR